MLKIVVFHKFLFGNMQVFEQLMVYMQTILDSTFGQLGIASIETYHNAVICISPLWVCELNGFLDCKCDYGF